VGSPTPQTTVCYWVSFIFFGLVFIKCDASFIVCVALGAVVSLSVFSYFVWLVYFCVLCLVVIPLPPGKVPFAGQSNNSN
jgi:hypothetical protein